MKHLLYVIVASFHLANTAVAVNQPCAPGFDDYGTCICIDAHKCVETYGGSTVKGSPGNYPCPRDPANVMGCYNIVGCMGPRTECRWRASCPGRIYPSE